MRLKFNLTTLPSSEVAKVDQNGEAVQGAEFALYQSDANWKAQGDPIAQGTTDDKGQLVFLKSDGSVLSFDNQHADGHDPLYSKRQACPRGTARAWPRRPPQRQASCACVTGKLRRVARVVWWLHRKRRPPWPTAQRNGRAAACG